MGWGKDIYGLTTIKISRCPEGVYLRWWFNGWHYFNFVNGYEIQMQTESMDTQTTQFFSVISKIERPTRIKAEYSYKITLEGITPENIAGFTGLLMAEKVMQYEEGVWREVDITRGYHGLRQDKEKGFFISFEIKRKELPYSSSVYKKTLKLYLGDTLCDMDDDEVVPINKQTNDIAEMQDRQSDFTAQFRIRKTRAMRALFELSGEVGASTTFPYENQTCKLIQDNIEIISAGTLILNKVDDQYYYVSILSGNKDFFKEIETLKITDLTLASADHTWNVATMVNTHTNDLDYVYPLCEPSDDGGIAPLDDDGDRVEMYGGWIWPFVKARAIWDEIFDNAGFTCEGDILEDEIFDRLFLPITSRKVTKKQADKYLYSIVYEGIPRQGLAGQWLGNTYFSGTTLLNGDITFLYGNYMLPYDATYKIHVKTITGTGLFDPNKYPTLTIYLDAVSQGEMIRTTYNILGSATWELEVTGTAGQILRVYTSTCYYWYFAVRIVEIIDAAIAYGSTLSPKDHLPGMLQKDFLKMVCNMFGLIPEVNPRDRVVKFWNYIELYDNIPLARDWSAFLSERDDEVEFKYGEYAQDNYLNYSESDDVVIDQGRGSMHIDDTTLPAEKDVVELPISTCDEVIILTNIFDVNVSRINFNIYNPDTSAYDAQESIDSRIVYVDHIREIASPPYEKTFGIRATVAPGAATDIDSPKKATSIDVSFSSLVYYYASLSRLLTKTKLRRVKFNLPVYEVAGFRHYIPIYLSQYKAYFYVNKINNYVPGKLCTIDLIRL